MVSGTIIFTHTNCSTIMPQKNRKTVPGWKKLTIDGKNRVSRAANNQCVKVRVE